MAKKIKKIKNLNKALSWRVRRNNTRPLNSGLTKYCHNIKWPRAQHLQSFVILYPLIVNFAQFPPTFYMQNLWVGNSEESNLSGKFYFPFSKGLEQDPDSQI